jgi:hypothetical protein
MAQKRLGRKRLAVDIPDIVHQELKMLAAQRNCTITKLVLKSIFNLLRQESHASFTTKD